MRKESQGEIPCANRLCRTNNNPRWFTDNELWNGVMKEDKHQILCVNCFISRAEKEYNISGWKLSPIFKEEEE